MILGTLVTVASPREASKNSKAATEAGIPLIVDSGAWSNFTGAANVTVNDHMQYLTQNWVAGARHLALDVIGEPQKSFANWVTERDAGLAVEPTIHYGTDPTLIDSYLRKGLATEWINLGGMAHLQSIKSLHRKMASWSAAVIKRCPSGTKFHALGGTTPGLNHLIKFDAVDSTYWLQVMKFGTVSVFDPSVPRWVGIPRGLRKRQWKNGQYQRLGRLGELLRERHNVSASEVLAMSEDELIILAMEAHCQLGDHFEKRHGHKMNVYLAGSGSKHYEDMKRLNQKWSKQ
jgi:hypothetical protein